MSEQQVSSSNFVSDVPLSPTPSLQLVQVIINITHLSECKADLEKYLSNLTKYVVRFVDVLYYLCVVGRTDSEDGQVSRLYGLSTFKVCSHCSVCIVHMSHMCLCLVCVCSVYQTVW